MATLIYFGIATVDPEPLAFPSYREYRGSMRFLIIALIFIVVQRPRARSRIDKEAAYRGTRCFIVHYYRTLAGIASTWIIAANKNNKV